MNEEILTNEMCNETSDPVYNDGEVIEKEEKSEAEDLFSDTEGSEKSDTVVENEVTNEPEKTVEGLRAELDALRAELEEKRAAFERMSTEIGEFSELFPSISISSIPDSVWQSVKEGIPLAASYALYEKKTSILLADAKRTNEKNSALSTGPLGREATSDFFSPDEVRAMSRDEVRKNYSKIMESMKKWN